MCCRCCVDVLFMSLSCCEFRFADKLCCADHLGVGIAFCTGSCTGPSLLLATVLLGLLHHLFFGLLHHFGCRWHHRQCRLWSRLRSCWSRLQRCWICSPKPPVDFHACPLTTTSMAAHPWILHLVACTTSEPNRSEQETAKLAICDCLALAPDIKTKLH